MTLRQWSRTALLTAALCSTLGLAGGFMTGCVHAAPRAAATGVDIPFEQFTLPNGLRVVVHTDRKAPIVAVNLWYHVGSKDEPAGRTGFAHLFEHLMFNGSENHKGEFFGPFEMVGATDMNGTTNQDRTNYFENVPTTALDMALWMESDRMGHLLGAIDQATLDEQRGVVQNEKRQGENQPYGQVWQALSRAMYPVGHPYHHSVIGSMNDLNAATLEDVKNWFRTWYGPNNAVLVLAGDIDAETAREKAVRYFGDIPATPSMTQPAVDPAKRDRATREVMTDNVPQARIYRAWNVAQAGSDDVEKLQLLAQVLGGSASSRLDRRLLHEDTLVDSISADIDAAQLGSNFLILASVKQGVDASRVEAIIDEELKKLLAEGPSATELAQAKTVFRAGFIRGIERIGGFGGKADTLAECAIYEGDPGCFRHSLSVIDSATSRQLRDTGKKWLDTGDHTVVVEPGERMTLAEEPSVTPTPMIPPPADPKYTVIPGTLDRSQGVQIPTRFPDLVFPSVRRTTLSNGTQVVLAERHEIPVVQMSYLFNGGAAADPADRPGTGSFTLNMLGEGAGDLDALAFADRAETLGAELDAGASLDGGSVSLSALKENLDASADLFSAMLRRPRFDQREIDRVKATWLAAILQEKAHPNGAAMRVLPPLLYGKGHPYAIPFSGRGTEAAIQSLRHDDLNSYWARWIHPEDATLVIVGDTTLAEIAPILERHFGGWKGSGSAADAATIADVARPSAARVYLIDQPGAVQANIFAGELVPSTKDADATRFDIADSILGGEFSSRLNMNLREDKHWAYGAYSFTTDALGQRPWMAFAPVQIDKTDAALQEMDREIREYASGSAPPTAEEVGRTQATEIRSLPGAYETAAAVLRTLSDNVRYQRPDDYVFQRKAEVEGLTPAQVRTAAATIDPNRLIWVVVGDLSQIEQPIRALELGEVRIIDADGNPVARP
ncbi:MAG: insulinase family protein [Xanthomonadaceae bacterium]|jgi:predicted Zn-dependent peptidase|nr:insulinase family protein [Xanthomonadaceae bacterium]